MAEALRAVLDFPVSPSLTADQLQCLITGSKGTADNELRRFGLRVKEGSKIQIESWSGFEIGLSFEVESCG